jgi:hypothetical protein
VNPEEAECAFISPDGEWTLRFFDPSEFAMGAYRWSTALNHRSGEAKLLPDSLDPERLQPWSPDSRTYTFRGRYELHGASRLILGRVAENQPSSLTLADYPVSVEWSPRENRLLVVSKRGATLFDAEAKVRAVAHWAHPENEWPISGWMPNGAHFFVLSREAENAPSEIRFYRSSDAQLADRVEVDPARLVPWDAAPYRKLRRDFWSLEVGEGSGAIGSFLDTWHDFRYGVDGRELSLGTYRPISPPFSVKTEWGDEWVCRAEERWIALELLE